MSTAASVRSFKVIPLLCLSLYPNSGDFNGLIALKSKKYEVYLSSPLIAVTNGASRYVCFLSVPPPFSTILCQFSVRSLATTEILIHAPLGDGATVKNSDEWYCWKENRCPTLEDFGWIRLLSHLIDACPNLTKLDVIFEPDTTDDLYSYHFEALIKFRDCVLPHLPTRTKTAVRIMFAFDVLRCYWDVSPFSAALFDQY